MKLFLTSYGLGGHDQLLVDMVDKPGARMAIITNALDAFPIEAQQAYWKIKPDFLMEMIDLGFDPSLVDLRRFFGRPADLARVMAPMRLVWAVGGNSFLLRRAMRDSGFDALLPDMLADGIVCGGVSAGACVMSEDMRAIALMDAPEERAPGYATDDPIDRGLGLVPFTIIPHYRSDHAEAEGAENGVAFARANGIAHVPLRDGQVIVRRGDAIETLPPRG
ncbi:Type 1 glutamine amidotransferase-like domain-containing protein [Sphingobium nicotianae]|uniref:Type 1 glutamine amidotransferase-like domain-containing protein n=1 Tax=Sphingobium nicotianae TaxID=2782607 RepID=A0A9X1IQ05_9SPHN|nr:Type 1 glutamine amidotransferase-like domain-containing protein [Sphingobium nicotianae]MBT2186448.1 Type 1 glutamine amidotransferase-like domain-containing protein [Sphingobium nicotianae]